VHGHALAGLLGAAACLGFQLLPSARAHQTLFERIADPVFGVVLLGTALLSLRRDDLRRLALWKLMSYALALYILGSFAAKLAAGGPNPYIDKASCSRETDLEEAMFRAILAEQAATKAATN
jgi:hypothetical protein